MSLHISRLFKATLAITAAALVIHVGTASAADFTADTQQQIKNLLTGTSTAHSALQFGPREGKVSIATVDAQESVKQLLLGTGVSGFRGAEAIEHSEVATASDVASPRQRKVTNTDMQATVQKILLGQHEGTNASLVASRSTR